MALYTCDVVRQFKTDFRKLQLSCRKIIPTAVGIDARIMIASVLTDERQDFRKAFHIIHPVIAILSLQKEQKRGEGTALDVVRLSCLTWGYCFRHKTNSEILTRQVAPSPESFR